jgi:hypothetical protein
LVAGVSVAGCSSPSEGGGLPDPPSAPPPGLGTAQNSAGGTTQQNTALGGTGGQGGTAPVATNGGTGGSTGGTAAVPAGTAGSAGSAAMAGGTDIPTGVGFALTPVNGFVAGASNQVGIQGYFYTYSDASQTPPGNTVIMPADFAASAGSAICASGTASQVLMMDGGTMLDYTRYYGGGVGLNLADPGGMMAAQPWDRGEVTGFSFNITGTDIPTGQLRLNVTFYEGASVNTTPYCANIAAGANTIRFSDIHAECYNGNTGANIPATAQLQALQWQVATVDTAPTPFNYCIENLTALTN